MSLGVLAENYTRGMWQNDDIITATICQAEIRPSRTYPGKSRRRLATMPPSSRSIETPSRQRARKGKPPSNGTKLSWTAPAILAFTSTSRLRPAMRVLRVPLGTRSTKSGRSIRVRPRALYQALQQARAEQSSVAFAVKQRPGWGIEGTIAQAVRAFELRATRYFGLAKTHLQSVALATAISLCRFADLAT